MYIWQLCVEEQCYYGRYWNELIDLLDAMSAASDDRQIIIYIHNLSYEFAFLRGIIHFETEDVFLMDERKPLYARYKNIEFRCSYRLFNMPLSKVLISEDVTEEYQKTELDYDAVRYPWTPLKDDELIYCRNDVAGLVLAIRHRLNKTGDTLATIPYTSTGYVRRMVKSITHDQRKYFELLSPKPEVYMMLRSAMRGGNTHANRYYTGAVNYNVYTADISSSYPTQLQKSYPMTPWKEEDTENEHVLNLIYDTRHAVLMQVRFYDLDCGSFPIPYISNSNLIAARPEYKKRRLDNGRVLNLKMGEMCITDIDYKIIAEEYTFSRVEFVKVYTSVYKPMPAGVVKYLRELYYQKSTLKRSDPYMYARSKEYINACYGMAAQDIARETIELIDGKTYKVTDPDMTEEGLKKASAANALPYAVGVWCTAYAREQLERGFRYVLSQGAKIIYCDTDSIKYTGVVDWDQFNSQIIKENYSVTVNGITYTMGVFEQEEKADQFKTLGAKKYVAVYGDDLKITIAGVPKTAGAEELKAAGGIDAFETGFEFCAGKLEAVYNDDSCTLEVDGHTIEILSDVTLYPTTYKVNVTKDYSFLIDTLTGRKIEHIMKIAAKLRG